MSRSRRPLQIPFLRHISLSPHAVLHLVVELIVVVGDAVGAEVDVLQRAVVQGGRPDPQGNAGGSRRGDRDGLCREV
eukprot:16343612-Heterocapsa_arctica.AAC.1